MGRVRRYAILSDIHANIEALEAVLRDIDTQRIDDIVCLGDVVGYNAAPVECIRRIRSLGCRTVKGNHDHYCSSPEVNLDDFQPNAASVIAWTRRMLGDDDMAWLHNLPMQLTYMGFTMVHSTLDCPASFRYAFEPEDAADSFNCQRSRVCFHGHTHVPCIFYRPAGGDRNDIRLFGPADGKLESGNYFINVGSVGQPRDGNSEACYAIFTMDGMTDLSIAFRRVDYDLETAVQRIETAGLPERLATRLYKGV